jgi:ADP-ribose pyrophosphatase YjhB (NUDIX family)
VRRAIEPRKGSLALPGGYINWGESWQQAGAREVAEETGLALDPAELSFLSVHSAPDSTLLVFAQAAPRPASALPAFAANDEVSELVIVAEPTELAFSLHTRTLAEWFARVR